MSSSGKTAGLVGLAIGGISSLIGAYFLGKKSGQSEGRRESKAHYSEEIKKLSEQMVNMMADIAKREDFIVVAYAVGVCCASANQNLSERKIETLDYLIAGVGSREKLSQTARQKISFMLNNPPNLNTVWSLINKHNFNDDKHLTVFTEIIEVVAASDGDKTKQDADFISSWNTLVA